MEHQLEKIFFVKVIIETVPMNLLQKSPVSFLPFILQRTVEILEAAVFLGDNLRAKYTTVFLNFTILEQINVLMLN